MQLQALPSSGAGVAFGVCCGGVLRKSEMAESGGGLSKWHLAVAVGAPFAVGIGYWYYRRSRSSRKQAGLDRAKSNSVESTDEAGGEPKPITEQELLDKAESLKTKGNKFFKGGTYEKAIECYSEALAVCPPQFSQSLATFYQNRAAAHEKAKNHAEVINDCTAALDLNNKYVKALVRRAKAYEATGQLREALEDVTAVCILEQFENQSSLVTADRVLKKLGTQRAQELLAIESPLMPSKHFVKSYFESFTEDPTQVQLNVINGNDSHPDSPYLRARTNLASKDYDDIIEDCTLELKDEQSVHRAEAFLLRATLQLLRGQTAAALADLEELLQLKQDINKKTKVNALIKRATIHVHKACIGEALEDFSLAVKTDPDNADIYHHRGAIFLLTEKAEEAVEDFKNALRLNPSFSMAAVQKCFAEFRLAHFQRNQTALGEAIDSFGRVVNEHKNCVEGYILFAQALTDTQDFERADQYYNSALKIDPSNANVYVHKGLLQLQWKSDVPEALRLMELAIEKDSKCAFAYETLGTIHVQRGDLDGAEKKFDDAIALVRNESELSHLFSLKEAASAQRSIAQKLGITVPRYDI